MAAVEIRAEIEAWKAAAREHRVAGRKEDAAACGVAIGALRRLQQRLGITPAPFREDFPR